MITAALLVLLGTQKLPTELQVSQLEDPRVRNAGIVVIGGQNPVITNTQQSQLPATQLEQRPQVQGLNATFDVNFRDASLVPVLNTLAQYAGLNLVIPPDINGIVTVDLKNVTLLQALEAILPPRGLQYRIDDGLLRVEKVQLESRSFKFDYITTTRSLSRSISASSSAGEGAGIASGAIGGTTTGTVGPTGAPTTGATGGGGTSTSSVSGAERIDLLADIQTALNTLKSPDGKVIFNRMAGVVFATDYPRYLDQIGFFLETIQTAVHRQVVIEAKVVEIQLKNSSQFGVNWTAVAGQALKLEQPFTTTGGFQITATSKEINATINALATEGYVNVLSNPTISTLNNQPAIIRVGTQDIFFSTTTQVDPRTGTIVQTAITPSAINEGVVLDVTPQISDDGIIIMNVHPSVTSRTGQATSPQGDTVPIVDVRETDTVVRVREGGTVMIGGLISDQVTENESKVPILSNLPLVGGLFRSTTRQTNKTDLVILLTPKILDVESAVDYTKSRMESQENLKAQGPK
jgi:MSHA type pilus biogenesis protein MshL